METLPLELHPGQSLCLALFADVSLCSALVSLALPPPSPRASLVHAPCLLSLSPPHNIRSSVALQVTNASDLKKAAVAGTLDAAVMKASAVCPRFLRPSPQPRQAPPLAHPAAPPL